MLPKTNCCVASLICIDGSGEPMKWPVAIWTRISAALTRCQMRTGTAWTWTLVWRLTMSLGAPSRVGMLVEGWPWRPPSPAGTAAAGRQGPDWPSRGSVSSSPSFLSADHDLGQVLALAA